MNNIPTSGLRLDELLGTKERIIILNQILYLEDEFGVIDISKKANLSKGLVSKYLFLAQKYGLIIKKKRKFVIQDNISVKILKILLNFRKISPKLFKEHKFITAAGIYGSNAKGTNTISSDVDIWIKIAKAKDEQIAFACEKIRSQIQNAKILVLDKEKIKKLKDNDRVFYDALFFGSIIIYGSENEIYN